MALDQELQNKQLSLNNFLSLSARVLNYLPEVISNYHVKGDYKIGISNLAGTTKYIRPINRNLFIDNVEELELAFSKLKRLLACAKRDGFKFGKEELENIDQTVYTIQQSIGVGLDLMVNPNAARKHVGIRFEELIKCIFDELGVSNQKTVLQIPYEGDTGNKVYKCENDLILSPHNQVESTTKFLDEKEIVVSIKTTSKDRMGKIFIDKLLLERFIGHPQKIIGIFLNDVQRKEEDNISFTLVSGLFMVYTQFLTELEGIYYLDPPPNVSKEPYNRYMKRFSQLIAVDIWKILAS